MSWSRALLVAAVLALGPTGCGFRPLYGPTQALPEGVQAHLSAVRVRTVNEGVYREVRDVPEDRSSQLLRNAVVQRLTPAGEPGDYRYLMTITMAETVQGMGEHKDTLATLGRMDVVARFKLFDASGRELTKGESRAYVSFNFTGPRYASVVLERDARDRAIEDIAEDIRQRVAGYFINREKAGAGNP
ncbi:MAG: LPS assembly lipoprotein LptE [Solirubrobacterales bacterium]